MIIRVVSGGQTGVDQAALRAAHSLGIQTGGWAPANYMTEAGPFPLLKTFYGLQTSPHLDYPGRTRANVDLADVTLWIGDVTSPGGRRTAKEARSAGKLFAPMLIDHTPGLTADYLAMLAGEQPFVLNVAGNRESKAPGIGEKAEAFLREVFTALLKKGAKS